MCWIGCGFAAGDLSSELCCGAGGTGVSPPPLVAAVLPLPDLPPSPGGGGFLGILADAALFLSSAYRS